MAETNAQTKQNMQKVPQTREAVYQRHIVSTPQIHEEIQGIDYNNPTWFVTHNLTPFHFQLAVRKYGLPL